MSDQTKITLSSTELSLVSDSSFILTKRAIIDKVYNMFSDCSRLLIREIFEGYALPPEIASTQPKISKGESYLSLPYVMLDYPRYFSGDDAFAFRTMFWWGNFFSITLHISGKYRAMLDIDKLNTNCMAGKELFICINKDDAWQHHFGEDNYRLCSQMEKKEIKFLLESFSVIKLAMKFPLEEWNRMPLLLEDGYKKLASLLISYPAGGKAPLPGTPITGSGL